MTSRAIRDALDPFLSDRIGWTLHFPMYVNTFCLAHHLAIGLAASNKSAADIDQHFVLDDWWRGSPTFMYRTDIEIFVGVDEAIERLRCRGHKILEKVKFTNYDQHSVFTRTLNNAGDHPIVVTDIITTAKKLREDWKKKSPAWLPRYGASDPATLEICNSWSRTIGSLIEKRKKIYIFGAPMTQILLAQSGSKGSYIARKASAPAIPTYYVFRCNAGVPDADIRELKTAIERYYAIIFGSDDAVRESGIALPRDYARLAMSSGQPNPFPEIYRATGPNAAPPDEGLLTERYAEMLKRHHQAAP